MVVLLLLLFLDLAFSEWFCGLNYEVQIKHKVWKKTGKVFRRTDVILYLPLEYTTRGKIIEGLAITVKQSENNARILVETKDPLREDWLLVIPLKNSYVEEYAKVEKIKSEKPLIKEVFSVYPFSISERSVKFPMPPLNPTEKLRVKLKHKGKIGFPVGELKEKKEVKKKKRVKIVYSFTFGYAKTTTNDLNLRNLKEIIKVLSAIGKLERIDIIGMADGKTKNPNINEEVAKRRALYIAERLLGKERIKCLLRK